MIARTSSRLAGINAASTVRVENNLSYGHLGSGDAGINLTGSARAIGNTVYRNYHGIRASSDGTVMDNRAFANTLYGIEVTNSAWITENVTYDNGRGIGGGGSTHA